MSRRECWWGSNIAAGWLGAGSISSLLSEFGFSFVNDTRASFLGTQSECVNRSVALLCLLARVFQPVSLTKL